MKFPRLIAVAVATLVFTSGFGISQERDLAQYKKLPAIQLDEPSLTDTIRQKRAAELREFVADCWTRKVKGYVSARAVSKEGDVTTTHYYIEPDATGAWTITGVIERQPTTQVAAGAAPPANDVKTEKFTAYMVEKVSNREKKLLELTLMGKYANLLGKL